MPLISQVFGAPCEKNIGSSPDQISFEELSCLALHSLLNHVCSNSSVKCWPSDLVVVGLRPVIGGNLSDCKQCSIALKSFIITHLLSGYD